MFKIQASLSNFILSIISFDIKFYFSHPKYTTQFAQMLLENPDKVPF